MKRLFLAFAIVTLIGVPAKSIPHIVSQSVVHPTNCPDDPLMSFCTIVSILFENPLFQPVVVVLDCGEEVADVKAEIPARVRIFYEAEIESMNYSPVCKLKSWKVK